MDLNTTLCVKYLSQNQTYLNKSYILDCKMNKKI